MKHYKTALNSTEKNYKSHTVTLALFRKIQSLTLLLNRQILTNHHANHGSASSRPFQRRDVRHGRVRRYGHGWLRRHGRRVPGSTHIIDDASRAGVLQTALAGDVLKVDDDDPGTTGSILIDDFQLIIIHIILHSIQTTTPELSSSRRSSVASPSTTSISPSPSRSP